jgi:hypothetical protein
LSSTCWYSVPNDQHRGQLLWNLMSSILNDICDPLW